MQNLAPMGDQPHIAGVDGFDGVELGQEDGLVTTDQLASVDAVDGEVFVLGVRSFNASYEPLGIAAEDAHPW